MVKPLEWHPEFEIGIADLDRDHRELLDQNNAFLQRLHAGCSAAEAAQAFDHFMERVRRHFFDEERYLEEIGYEALDVHRKEHQALLDDLNGERDRVLSFQDGESLDDLISYFQFWMVRHLSREDQAIADYLAKKQTRSA